MGSADTTRIRTVLREALKSQMRDAAPPQTKATFERLRATGIPEDAVWQLLSAALLAELNAMTREARPYNEAAYIRRLEALPQFSPE